MEAEQEVVLGHHLGQVGLEDPVPVEHDPPGVQHQRGRQQTAQRAADQVAADRRRAAHGSRSDPGGRMVQHLGHALVDPAQHHRGAERPARDDIGLRHVAQRHRPLGESVALPARPDQRRPADGYSSFGDALLRFGHGFGQT